MGDDADLERELLGDEGVDVFVSKSPRPGAWINAARKADAILTRHAPIRGGDIRQLERCRIIARYGTGHDNIDVGAAAERGITVTFVPDYCADEVADHTLCLLLAAARHLPSLTDSVRSGGWTPRPLPPIQRLRGLTLGLLGCGRIGAAVAARARSFGFEIVAYDPYATELPDGVARAYSVEELVERSHILSLHAPVTPETEGVLDAARIARMPEGAILINVARGRLVDLDAAIAALASGRLAALALDVLDEEPPPADHPVRALPGALITPHVAYYSISSVEEAKRRSVEEVLRALAGQEPLHPVSTTSASV
jgi:D-3-phosphoglycerate dehydrogenase